MSHVKAKDLSRGDVFRMHVYGEVITAESVADSKRIKIHLSLENQGGRTRRGGAESPRQGRGGRYAAGRGARSKSHDGMAKGAGVSEMSGHKFRKGQKVIVKPDPTIFNHTAIHEAGHAVIGRVLNMVCGAVTIVADDESAGHAICGDQWEIDDEWCRQGRYREQTTIWLGRIMTFMAGAEAEAVILGNCSGGDGNDRYQVMLMLEEIAPKDTPAMESRLRRWAATLCRRHIDRIKLLASVLMREGFLSDNDVRALIGIPKPCAD
jgi:hypothetical protein